MNISHYSLIELQEYFKQIKATGINPNEELFKSLPDMDLILTKQEKLKASDEDVQKMLLWVLCQANIKVPN